MVNRLYLGDAFGWDTNTTAQVAISQLREEKIINATKCPKAQLIKNESVRWLPNIIKILGYIPIINVIAGIVAIKNLDNSPEYHPNHTAKWRGRGVAMILAGPILLVVDLITHISNLRIAKKYMKEHPDLIESFNTKHEHTPAYWPKHPVYCKNTT